MSTTRSRLWPFAVFLCLVFARPSAQENSTASLGYYRFPAIHGDTIVFTAEGDLWRVGRRRRRRAAPDDAPGRGVASRDLARRQDDRVLRRRTRDRPRSTPCSLDGGVPVRQTYEGGNALVVGWTPAGEVLYSTRRFSTLPNPQLARVDPRNGVRTLVPLAQASDGTYDATGRTLYFTRLAFQGSYTKRYQGGTAQNLWRFATGDKEATPLTSDYAGTSKTPDAVEGVASTSSAIATAR